MPKIIEQVGIVDVLKIDIEGAEVELFSGELNWLDHVACIVIELHDERRSGCSDAFSGAISGRQYTMVSLGENIRIPVCCGGMSG